jgi:hypothetical protein
VNESMLTLTLDRPGALDAVADCIAQLRCWAREARAEQTAALGELGGRTHDGGSTPRPTGDGSTIGSIVDER